MHIYGMEEPVCGGIGSRTTLCLTHKSVVCRHIFCIHYYVVENVVVYY